MEKLTEEFLKQILGKEDVSIEDKIKLILAEAESEVVGLKNKNKELLDKVAKEKETLETLKQKENDYKKQVSEMQQQLEKNSPEETKKFLEAEYKAKETEILTQLQTVTQERDGYRDSHVKRLRDEEINKALDGLKVRKEVEAGFVAVVLQEHKFDLHEIDGKSMFLDQDSKPISAVMHEFALSEKGKGYLEVPFSGGSTSKKTGTSGGADVKNPWKAGQVNLTEQCKITKENPELAKRLKAEAKS